MRKSSAATRNPEKSTSDTRSPAFMPVLSPGRHRNAGRGACFMEYASYLAGESWSDHPACTSPTLGALARLVNDCVSDAARERLVPLIPSVIGLDDDDPRTTLLIAVRAGSAAIPIASMTRQRAIAAGLLYCERLLRGLETGGGAICSLAISSIHDALNEAPDAAAWARSFMTRYPQRRQVEVETVAVSVMTTSVVGIAEACVPDADDRLVALLESVIAELSADATPPSSHPLAIQEISPTRHTDDSTHRELASIS